MFVVDSGADRQPVEQLHERKSMATFPRLEVKPHSAVLYFLKFVKNVLGATGKTRKRVGVVELGQYKGTDKGFS